MDFDNIIFEKSDGVAKITLNRPQEMNAINRGLLEELLKALNDVEGDDQVKVLVITGAGKAFCVGGDLKYLSGLMSRPMEVLHFTRFWKNVYNAIEDSTKPVIAAINGVALAGGLELVLVCDLAVASEDAMLGDQHANYGLVAGIGGTQRLPRIVGIRRAKELLLTGDWISAQEAYRIGLVNRVAPAGELKRTVDEMVSKLVTKSPLAAKATKRLVNLGMQTDLRTALELECGLTRELAASEDVKEGVRAFGEKRAPVFKGS